MIPFVKRSTLILILIACAVFPITAQIKLPALISDGMVLQRDAEVNIWGWATPGEKIIIDFNNGSHETVANDQGEWKIVLKDLKAGGPYSMNIKGTNSITINDILVGDIWVCSGQSNMELKMGRAAPIYQTEIANSENNYIRYFAAPESYDFNNRRQNYNGGSWKSANPENVLNFGAIAYFFAREINQKYDVPIGIINTAIGGTPIEAWISEEAIKSFPGHYDELQRFKDSGMVAQLEQSSREKSMAWYKELGKKDEGYKYPDAKWNSPSLDDKEWPVLSIPGYWNKTDLGVVTGIVWFRKYFDAPASMAGKQADLFLGRIINSDSTFVNGRFVGNVTYEHPPRIYTIPEGVIKEGKNSIVVKVICTSGIGAFVPDKPYEINCGTTKIDLKGDWKYHVGALMSPRPGIVTVKYKPAGLFNAMISPLLNYRIKGVLWYQGESNAERPAEHAALFPAMINDWRKNWNQGDFPFLYVQLPNFQEANAEPSESNWALFRETQLRALSVANTGMAVTIDIGEWNDIHPLNKLDVGRRLALVAQKVAYDEDSVIYSGPVYRRMEIKGNEIVLYFDHTGSGLITRGDALREFSVAGEDKKFVWANAWIEENKIIVSCEKIPNPVAVRYAWANNPEGANLYNKEGLPASPFRTDDW